MDFAVKTEQIKQKLQEYGAEFDLLKPDFSSSLPNWETSTRYIPAGKAIVMKVPLQGTSLAESVTISNLIPKHDLEIIFVPMEKNVDVVECTGILIDGKEYRFVHVETLEVRGIKMLYAGYLVL